MQQKVQLAATVIHEPELLVLDEPFSGLDPLAQGAFREILAEHRAAGRTALVSTHVLEQAEKLCDAIALVARGRVVLSGELATIRRERSERAVAVRFDRVPESLAGLPGVVSFAREGDRARFELAPEAGTAALLAELLARGAGLRELREVEADLEAIFVQAVRDAG